jgi:vesicle coat complex subunit
MHLSYILLSADMEVRRKALSIVLSMTSSRNVEEVVMFLKKQLQRTQEQEFDKVCYNTSMLSLFYLIFLGNRPTITANS